MMPPKIQKVIALPNASFSGSNDFVMMNTDIQLNSTVNDVAMPLISDDNNSPIIIHGIGPYPKLKLEMRKQNELVKTFFY